MHHTSVPDSPSSRVKPPGAYGALDPVASDRLRGRCTGGAFRVAARVFLYLEDGVPLPTSGFQPVVGPVVFNLEDCVAPVVAPLPT